MSRYGLPYKGSKNKIAEWVVDKLPSSNTFVDLFCGGCSITHCAMLSKKYNNFIINDIDGRLPDLFVDAINGKYRDRNEWVSREEFNRLKNDDAFIALCWSFGNNGKDYLYSKKIEDFKKAYHYAVVNKDITLLKRYIPDIDLYENVDDIVERYRLYKKVIRLESFERKINSLLQGLENISRLQGLENISRLHLDYQQVEIPNDSVIYCDIPYRNTNCGKYKGFDHERFYEWALKQDNIFISEYEMPSDFISVAKTEKYILSSTNGTEKKKTEHIFTNQKTLKHYKSNDYEQMEMRW